MQSVLDVSIQSIYNLEDKIINWTQLNHYPVINIKRTYNTNWLNVSIENSTNMWIFVNITTQSHSNLNKTLPKVWLLPHKPYQLQTIDFIDKNDWVLANIQSGCYRVNYDAENWSRLSKYLNFNAFDNIHVLDRAKIIDDTFHFLMTGRLNSTVFLDISHYLCRDADYIAWYPMFKNLEYMSNFFVFPESALIKV
ncbi:Aminopeptidase N [Camponotus floridanus]|uniref:Aminopeptidase N n=1 Tax=Camponotus floridanus TaxID=104421 RepID=E2AHL3_CAMFO|nr:Aminopeptidase N [Camponotus floridanus]